VKTKGEPPRKALEGKPVPALVEAYFELNQLKQLYRQGWLRRGIPPERCESVAEHVYSMAMLGWWIADAYFPQLALDKILRMTLLHELGEIYIGDIIPADRVSPAEKHHREREAMQQVIEKLAKGAEYLALWEEYEAGQSAEARFVHQLDRLEMACQAAVYQTQGYQGMEEFFASAEAAIEDPVLRGILADLRGL
jgi:putative hydrolase of HD superfamily